MMLRKFVSSLVLGVGLVAALPALADIEYLADDVATGTKKYTFDLLPGSYTLTLTDLTDSFSLLSLGFGQGANKIGSLNLVGSDNLGTLTFTIPVTASTQYSAIVYGKASGTGDYSLVISSVPEPALYGMLGLGLGVIALAGLSRRRPSVVA
jgi:hypothetical protein